MPVGDIVRLLYIVLAEALRSAHEHEAILRAEERLAAARAAAKFRRQAP